MAETKEERLRTHRPFLGLFSKRVIALSLEGASLKLLSFSRGEVETWAQVPVNPRFLRGGYVADPQGMGEVIGSALRARGITSGRLVCAFPGLGTISRQLSLPRAAETNLSDVVSREARRLMAYSPDSHYLFWQVLPGKNPSLGVYVLAVPREPLAALAEAVRVAHFKPWFIELKAQALARSVNQRQAIIAHGEANALEMAIVVDDLPVLLRSALLGEESQVPELGAGRLVDELGRTIDFYNSTHREAPLSMAIPVHLTGDLATHPPLAEAVTAATGRAVSPLAPPLPLPAGFPVASFMVNLGLVLRKL